MSKKTRDLGPPKRDTAEILRPFDESEEKKTIKTGSFPGMEDLPPLSIENIASAIQTEEEQVEYDDQEFDDSFTGDSLSQDDLEAERLAYMSERGLELPEEDENIEEERPKEKNKEQVKLEFLDSLSFEEEQALRENINDLVNFGDLQFELNIEQTIEKFLRENNLDTNLTRDIFSDFVADEENFLTEKAKNGQLTPDEISKLQKGARKGNPIARIILDQHKERKKQEGPNLDQFAFDVPDKTEEDLFIDATESNLKSEDEETREKMRETEIERMAYGDDKLMQEYLNSEEENKNEILAEALKRRRELAQKAKQGRLSKNEFKLLKANAFNKNAEFAIQSLISQANAERENIITKIENESITSEDVARMETYSGLGVVYAQEILTKNGFKEFMKSKERKELLLELTAKAEEGYLNPREMAILMEEFQNGTDEEKKQAKEIITLNAESENEKKRIQEIIEELNQKYYDIWVQEQNGHKLSIKTELYLYYDLLLKDLPEIERIENYSKANVPYIKGLISTDRYQELSAYMKEKLKEFEELRDQFLQEDQKKLWERRGKDISTKAFDNTDLPTMPDVIINDDRPTIPEITMPS